MKTSLFPAVIGFFAAVLLPVSSATAVDIVVPDAGFDDHVLSAGGYIYIGDPAYTGAWKSHAGGDGAWLDNRYYEADGDLPPLSGHNKLYGPESATEDYVYQILDETFIEGAAYTLSVWVGQPWSGYGTGWWLYFTGEDYTDNLAEASGSAPESWQQVSLVYTATAADAGKKIGIKLQGEASTYVAFEDVTLSYGDPVFMEAADAGEAQVVAMHDVTDPNGPVDPNLLDPTHPAWPMAFATNPNSPLKPQPVAVKLNGSILPEGASGAVVWSVTDASQVPHVSIDDVSVLDPEVTFDEPNLYSLTLTVDDGNSVQTDSVLIKVKLAENCLQAHWKFDGDPDDPNDYDWNYTTYTGSPDFGPGLVGDAIILKQGDSVSYDNAIGAETSISVAFWMKPASDFASDGTGMIRKYSGTTSDPQGGWTFQLRSDTEMRWRCSSGWDGGAGDLKVVNSYPKDTWTHIVGTYDGDTGEMKFYLNGQLAAQRNASDTCFDSFIDEMTIGSGNWSGMIDDLYVFDYALNTDEIRPLISKGMNVAPSAQLDLDQVKILQPANEVQLTGTVFDEGAYTMAWTALDKPEGATVTFSDPAALPTSVQLESVGNYRLQLTVTDQGTPPLSNSAEIVVKVRPADFDGLEAHITFDDQTANSNLSTSVPYVGELFGGPGWNAGISGGDDDSCIQLDGVDDHINFEAYLGSDPCCTIALWVGRDDDDGSHIIQKWASNASRKGWLIRDRAEDQAGQIAIMIGSGFSGSGDYSVIDVNDAFVPPVAWTHLALTFDGSQKSFYLNGVQVFTDPVTEDFSAGDLVTPTVIGYRWNNESRYFMGVIDEVRIYDYALSAGELEAIYTADQATMPTP